MRTLLLLGLEDPNAIEAGRSEALWDALSIGFLLLIVVAVVVAGRYLVGLRRDAAAAAQKAAEAVADVRDLRRNLDQASG